MDSSSQKRAIFTCLQRPQLKYKTPILLRSVFTHEYDDEDSIHAINAEAWTRIPFYVVGKSTASALEDFQTICSSLGASSKLDIRGDHTGTGEQLARFILDDIKEDNISSTKRLLYLTGDKNRDTIPKILSSEEGKRRGIELDTVQVYETHGASSFEPSLNSHLERSPKGSLVRPPPLGKFVLTSLSTGNWWIVFFAPSSAEFAYPILQRHFRFTQSESSSTDPVSPHPPLAKIAAIGRVTSSYLEEELKLHVDAVATKPTPEALLAAITTTTT